MLVLGGKSPPLRPVSDLAVFGVRRLCDGCALLSWPFIVFTKVLVRRANVSHCIKYPKGGVVDIPLL